MNLEIPTPLIPFLGACLYGDAKMFYAGLDHAGRKDLEDQAGQHKMSAWLYRYLNDLLPESQRAEYRRVFMVQQANAIRAAYELKRVCGVMREAGLRFALIKGADLAYRVYSEPALRLLEDWDILFHPDDCDRALEVLSGDGWEIPPRYTDKHEDVMKFNEHHFSPHMRCEYLIEPHYTLPNFTDVDPHEIWEYTAELPGGGQHVLSPELNLLMLTRHAATKAYFHADLPKLLPDAAMIMRMEKVDFMKLRAMTGMWHLPYSGDLLAAFHEFFPEDIRAAFHADPEETSRFRTIFEERAVLGKPRSVSLAFSQFRAQGNTVRGSLDHILGCTPNRMRYLYRLPKHGAWGRLTWAYVLYFLTRSWRFVRTFTRHDKHLLQEYCTIVEEMESKASRKKKQSPE